MIYTTAKMTVSLVFCLTRFAPHRKELTSSNPTTEAEDTSILKVLRNMNHLLLYVKPGRHTANKVLDRNRPCIGIGWDASKDFNLGSISR